MSIVDDPRFFVPTSDPASPGNLEYEPSQERDLGPGTVIDAGPALADPDTAAPPLAVEQEVLAGLWLELLRAKRERIMEGTIGGESDASGNLTVKIADIPNGYRADLVRLLVEVAGFSVGSAATAGAWFAALEAGAGDTNPAAFPVGQLRAFAGTNASGLFLPAVVVESEKAPAPSFKGGRSVFGRLGGSQAALASKQVSITYKIVLTDL